MNARRQRETRLLAAAVALLSLFLLCFLILPVGTLAMTALEDSERLSLKAFDIFLSNPLYLESLCGSLGSALGAALMAATLALPIAWLVWRRQWQPPLLLQLFGFVPLFVPPFMLSLSLQSLLGRGGGPGLWLAGKVDLDPSQWGLAGLMVIEALHYTPLILALLILSTAPFAREANEAARLGASWQRLSARVFFPLGLPGLVFGMAIIFLKTLDDLATPLSLGITQLIAPQTYFRVTTYGAQDLLSSVLALALIAVSMLAWGLSAGFMRQNATHWQTPEIAATPPARGAPQRLGTVLLAALILFYGLCYSGMFLTAFAGVWSHTGLPESVGLMHFASALATESASFINTVRYCGSAAVIDVIIGLAIAYAIRRAPTRWGRPLNRGVAALLGVPGVALAVAYLQYFTGGTVFPWADKPFDATGLLLCLAFSIRGLPFAIPACAFALSNLPDSHLDAARFSGASGFTIARRIVLPALAFGLGIAFLICFGIAAVDLSSAMLLVPSETEAPAAYTIYLNMQTSTGRGTGSALAVLAIGALALAMAAAASLIRRRAPTRGIKPSTWLRKVTE